MKTYKRRDSATSVLRKMGIKPCDYGLFITKERGAFNCDIDLAKAHLKGLEEQKSKKAPRKSMTRFCKDMILRGFDNAAIFEMMKTEFSATEKHRYYPSWNRCFLRRSGQLPPAFDPINQDPNAIHVLGG